MSPQPITSSAAGMDLSPRVALATTIVASPALAAETIIASVAIPGFGDMAIVNGIDLTGWAAYTVGTSGTACRLRIRQTNVSGTVVGDTGALTGSQHGAGILSADDVEGFDATPGVGVYVLTLQVTAGSAASTVSATKLRAIVR